MSLDIKAAEQLIDFVMDTDDRVHENVDHYDLPSDVRMWNGMALSLLFHLQKAIIEISALRSKGSTCTTQSQSSEPSDSTTVTANSAQL